MEQGQKRLISHGPGETFALGVQMGKEAVPGQIFCLEGDLGVGKTVFTQGFARGLGIEQTVNSPTFTILQIYEEHALWITIRKDISRGFDYREILIGEREERA